jgi:hypothetical protein
VKFYSTHPGAPCQVRQAHFDYIAFWSSLDCHTKSSLSRGGVILQFLTHFHAVRRNPTSDYIRHWRATTGWIST